MKKIIGGAVLLAILAGGAYVGYRHFNGGAAASAPQSHAAAVTRGTIETAVTAQGKLEPKEYVDVGAQVSGLIVKMNVEVGDIVKQGDLIAEIDPDVYEARVKGTEARLETLQAQRIEQEALVRQSQQKLERNQKLIKDKAISREVLEDAQTSHDVAAARMGALEAQIKEVTSTLEGDRTNLNYTKIYAPMDGTVVSQSVKQGQTINANQTAPVIVQIANLDTMTARAQVAEADITKLSENMDMYFTILGARERRWTGTVRQILPAPETVNDVVLYNVLVDVENSDRHLMTGMTTQMFFILGRAENALLVPMMALSRRLPDADNDKGQAYEVRLAGGAVKTVWIGLSDRSKAVVNDGLAEGDQVLLNMPQAAGGNTGMPARMRVGRI